MLACRSFTFSLFTNKLFTTEHTKGIFGLKCNALVCLTENGCCQTGSPIFLKFGIKAGLYSKNPTK